ncbi:MAG: galactokinase [Chitinophagales bacterium]
MDQVLINQVVSEFEKQFKRQPLLIASPGRINLIGEHIDYNNGLVFPAAIDKYIVCGIQKNDLQKSRIYSIDKNECIEIDVDAPIKYPSGHWLNYITGIVNELNKKNLSIENFDLAFSGNIPMGSGLSSSAALENAVVFGLNELFHLKLSKKEMVQISMQAEHNFAGVQCGIMDQFASMFGTKDHALYLNCNDLSFDDVPIQLDDFQLVLINSNVKHEHVDSAYNERRAQSNEGFAVLLKKYPNLSGLCQATLEQLATVKDELSELVYKRCLFAIEENIRVKQAKVALEDKDWKKLGELLFASHDGLQNLYEVSCIEIDFLVQKAKENIGVLGSRMMGGGFGGCSINLIKKDKTANFLNEVKPAFLTQFGHEIDIYMINITNGTHIIQT